MYPFADLSIRDDVQSGSSLKVVKTNNVLTPIEWDMKRHAPEGAMSWAPQSTLCENH